MGGGVNDLRLYLALTKCAASMARPRGAALFYPIAARGKPVEGCRQLNLAYDKCSRERHDNHASKARLFTYEDLASILQHLLAGIAACMPVLAWNYAAGASNAVLNQLCTPLIHYSRAKKIT